VFTTDLDDPFLRWGMQRSNSVGMTNCFAVSRAENDTGITNYYSNYGMGYIRNLDYCNKFLGPLAVLGTRGPRQ
jgi:hypothetical protein